MGLLDTFHFDEDAYKVKIQADSTYVLRKKHHAKLRSQYANSFGIGSSLALAVPTAGTSLIGTAYSSRQFQVVERQKKIIERELTSRGVEIPREKNRDFAAGVGLGVVSMGVAKEIPLALTGLGLEHHAAHAASAAGTSAYPPTVHITSPNPPALPNMAEGATAISNASVVHAPSSVPAIAIPPPVPPPPPPPPPPPQVFYNAPPTPSPTPDWGSATENFAAGLSVDHYAEQEVAKRVNNGY